jgi:chloride channel protein, CIC family
MFGSIHRFFQKPIIFVRDSVSPKQFLIISGILVGLSSGIAAVALKYVVHNIVILVNEASSAISGAFLFAISPLIGISLTALFIHFVLKGRLRRGSAEIVYTIAKKSSMIPPREMYAHLTTSALTVGFGGSAGLESPMVSTGAAIGANFGSTYKVSYKDRTILLACGAASGIAAAFNAPIAGVLFAVEVLLTDVSASAFIPLIVSAACGALLSKIILAEGVIISFSLQQPFNYYNVPFYILLGLLSGLVALYYTKVFVWLDKVMKGIDNRWARAVGGGAMLFVLLAFFPPLFGEGYVTIKNLEALDPDTLTKFSVLTDFISSDIDMLLFLTAVMLLKAFAAGITIGSGGNGGNFAPSLFVGAYLGFVFARAINLTGLATLPESNFTLVAMAGLLSGVFYAPLTAIFLIAEITGGYELMIPLMIVSSLGVIIARLFEPLSMEARKLSARLNVDVEDRDKFLLSKLDLAQLIETNFSVVHPEESIASLVKSVVSSNRNMFPVVDSDGKLVGIVHMNNIRNVIFDTTRHEGVLVSDLMSKPEGIIHANENLHQVLQKFDETKQWNLPVVENDKYVGFLSKSSILTRYRSELLNSV